MITLMQFGGHNRDSGSLYEYNPTACLLGFIIRFSDGDTDYKEFTISENWWKSNMIIEKLLLVKEFYKGD